MSTIRTTAASEATANATAGTDAVPRTGESPVSPGADAAASAAPPRAAKQLIPGFSRVEHLGFINGLPPNERYQQGKPGALDILKPARTADGKVHLSIEFDAPERMTKMNKFYPAGHYWAGHVSVKDKVWSIGGPMTEDKRDSLQEARIDGKNTLVPRRGSWYKDIEGAGATVAISIVNSAPKLGPDGKSMVVFPLPKIAISWPEEKTDAVVAALQGYVDEATRQGRYAGKQEVMVKAIRRTGSCIAANDFAAGGGHQAAPAQAAPAAAQAQAVASAPAPAAQQEDDEPEF